MLKLDFERIIMKTAENVETSLDVYLLKMLYKYLLPGYIYIYENFHYSLLTIMLNKMSDKISTFITINIRLRKLQHFQQFQKGKIEWKRRQPQNKEKPDLLLSGTSGRESKSGLKITGKNTGQ